MRILQFGTQLIAEQIMLGIIQGFASVFGFHFERQPSHITTRDVIALRTRFATFTFFTSRQLLQFTVQWLDLPAHGILFFSLKRKSYNCEV